ncbi:hypothetical protein [Deinococcus cellulosilyticus]|uniref:Uncharacterized protein n=1 Tax=Deinococcus cellulosilyticus (strain DSM 18568 / NBRC 106333 / KACC 11606 / 5516J-15) TaxID=1223518 RepID=A0A511MZL1_DEIC1|nr:hypothetical protein [Deinococcus cellulosilyticus]GEM46023.1 hypothetical protein DC3_16580 [Deinococcus cellulosilyticus NBRC 106333 = KACC 11606]
MNTLLDEFIAAPSAAIPHFFNGRALSAEDLKRLYTALDNLDERFALLHGAGIASGLNVTLQSESLKISPGWGFTRLGTPVILESQVILNIKDIFIETDDGEFKNCSEGLFLSDTVQEGRVYILTVTPRERLEGRAPMFGMGGAPGKCNYKDRMPGVVFRLHRWADAEKKLGLIAPSRYQNALAHLCFGTPTDPAQINSTQDDFWTELLPRDPVRDLIPQDEEPLALLHTLASGWMLDEWAVRRTLYPSLLERMNEKQIWSRNHAMVQQYHLQLEQMVKGSGGDPTSLQASDFENAFQFLPPVGILPAHFNTSAQQVLTRSGARRLFHEALCSGEGFEAQQYRFFQTFFLDFSSRWMLFFHSALYPYSNLT